MVKNLLIVKYPTGKVLLRSKWLQLKLIYSDLSTHNRLMIPIPVCNVINWRKLPFRQYSFNEKNGCTTKIINDMTKGATEH
jgi:hypothetical protein